MNNERIEKRVYESGVEGRQGRPNNVDRWNEKNFEYRRLTLELARTTVHDRVEWRVCVR